MHVAEWEKGNELLNPYGPFVNPSPSLTDRLSTKPMNHSGLLSDSQRRKKILLRPVGIVTLKNAIHGLPQTDVPGWRGPSFLGYSDST